MSRRRLPLYFLFALIHVFIINQGFAQTGIRKLYVNVESENLRAAPQGQKIGTLLRGTEAVVLVEKEKWVKIQITGWMWKESMTTIRPKNVAGLMHALHILVATREEAEAILSELKSGKDFSELAKAKSIGPNAKKGGDLGYFAEGDFQAEFEKTIKSLKNGEISGIVKTSMGYHIFKRVK